MRYSVGTGHVPPLSQAYDQTAAILSSLTSTCQRHAVNPELYLTQLLVNLPDTHGSQLDAWLPDRWKARQQPAAVQDTPTTTP